MANRISDIGNIDIAKNTAEVLLSVKAVFLRPNELFTWASGTKSPMYCDNRLTLAYPDARRAVAKGLAETIKEYYPECEVVMGTATAGIPHAALVAEILNLPMGYVRSSAKDHGRNNQIEGADVYNKKVVLIEDLISTAGSSLEAVETLRKFGANLLGMASIFTYNLNKGIERLTEAKVRNISLTNIDVLADVALDKGYVNPMGKRIIADFITNLNGEV